MAETLRTLARTLNLDGQIVFAGEATAATLPGFYASADVFVLPTLYEGYGMAVAEALARGLPVVSTTTGAIAELVGDTAGIVVAPGDEQRLRAGLVAACWTTTGGRSSAARRRRPPRARHAADMGRRREQDGRRAEPGDGLMGGFSADWLALREPADARARSAALTRRDRRSSRRRLRVLDLAAGTGANVRYLEGFLRGDRSPHWLLVDNDPALLAKAAALLRAREAVETRAIDLSAAFEPAAANLCAGQDLVTASALLDLVSERWLHALAGRCADARAAVLFALTYNGDIRCSPGEPEDAMVRDLVNRHQRIDKGFGPALGPDAAASAAQAFAALGYDVRQERSDWVLAEDVPDLQRQLIEGWADAAAEVAPEETRRVIGWRTRRLAHVAAGRSRIVVGHDDLAAWLR